MTSHADIQERLSHYDPISTSFNGRADFSDTCAQKTGGISQEIRDLPAWREVSHACGNLKRRIARQDFHTAESSVARPVQRRVIERVLIAQLLCNLRISLIEPVEAGRFIEPAASRRTQLLKVTFACVQHAQAFTQVSNA